MDPEKLGALMASLTESDRTAFLLAYADEIPSEDAAAWLRDRAMILRPALARIGTDPLCWWFRGHIAYTPANGLPWGLFDALEPNVRRHDLLCDYSTQEQAWADLFRVLLQALPGAADSKELRHADHAAAR
jgi:hypothetical protein